MSPEIITLKEYQSTYLEKAKLSDKLGEMIGRNYEQKSRVLIIDSPDWKTQNQWKITPKGWAGSIRVSEDLALHLQPKVPLSNIFGMLDYAYTLKSFHFLKGLIDCDSIDSLFDHLAGVLARRISDRARRGLYRAYIAQTQRQQYIRGRLNIRHQIRQPWSPQHQCHYQEQTTDIIENQIFLFTLRKIALQLPSQSRNIRPVRRAYHALQNTVSLTAISSQDCINRDYNRLNEDYLSLHALCRFFLEQSGPSHQIGDRTMLPFLVNMARLYELFVAEWLKANVDKYLKPAGLDVRTQERVYLDDSKSLHFNIDLVLIDKVTGQPKYILDTKYKVPTSPSSSDTEQIIAYATVKNCSEAVLIYPQPLQQSLNTKFENLRVRCLTFSIDGDLEQSGKAFLSDLLEN